MANDGTVKIGAEFDEGDIKDGFKDIEKDIKKSANSFKDAEQSVDDFGEKLNGLSDIAKGVAIGDLISNGVQTAIGGLKDLASEIWNLDETTREYRESMGLLNTAFETAGYGPDAAKAAYQDFYAILGDTGQATEAAQLLATLADHEQDVTTWTQIAAGVYGTFGDALPIEGLMEASNETARVGQVTGVLADALNWVGISEDEFNAKLAACTTESERNQLIMTTLAGTYDEASEAFYRNNEALVASREVQADIDDSMAKVGEAVEKVKTAFMETFGPVIADAAEKVANFISGFDVNAAVDSLKKIFDMFVDLAPVIAGATAAFLAYKAAMSIAGLISGLSAAFGLLTGATTAQGVAATGTATATTAMNAALSATPIGGIITLVTALVGVIVTLWTTSEGFRDTVLSIFEEIGNAIDWVIGKVKSVIDWFKELFDVADDTSDISVGRSKSGGFSGKSRVTPAVKTFSLTPSPVPLSESDGDAGNTTTAGDRISLAAYARNKFPSLHMDIASAAERVLSANTAMAPAVAYAPVSYSQSGIEQGSGNQSNGAPQRVKLDIGFYPREAAMFLRPYWQSENSRAGTDLVD